MSRPRWQELLLLLFPIGYLLAGLAQLAILREGRVAASALLPGLLVIVALLVVHALLAWRFGGCDQQVLPIAAMLGTTGLLVVSRLQPDLGLRQAVWLVLGLAGMLVPLGLLPRVDRLKRFKYSTAALGILLVGATFLFGVDPNGSGARLWLGFGGLYFQPSEILKVLLVAFFAAYLDDYRELISLAGPRLGPARLPPLPYLVPLATMVLLALGILAWQRDLGAALLLFGVFLALLYAASGLTSAAILGLASFAFASWAAYRLFDVVQLRVAIWLDPWSVREGAGYQIVQALLAYAAGGVAGTGLGFGAPQSIPAAHTDFVIAAIAEEMGLIGSLAVVSLYALLVHRALAIALRTRDSFGSLLAAGLGSTVAIQALLILGGALRLVPLTGITLPLISYGGSSILANGILLGLLLRVSHESAESHYAR